MTQCQSLGRPCTADSVARVWSPTLFFSHKGPMSLCERHYRPFDPGHSPAAHGYDWQLGDAADLAFGDCTFHIRESEREAYHDVIRMLRRSGSHISGKPKIGGEGDIFDRSLWVLDGSCWLVQTNKVTMLGDWFTCRDRYPILTDQGALSHVG